MGLLDELKTKADANGDGKIDAADLKTLEGKVPTEQLDELKKKADANGDGKLDLSDVNGALSGLGDTLGGLKDKFFK